MRNYSRIFEVFAFWKPAYETVDRFAVDERAIQCRTGLVAATAFSLTYVITSSLAIPVLTSIGCLYLYNNWEWSRATQKLNQLAVEEFKNTPPTGRSRYYITKNEACVDMLIANNCDLTKRDIGGFTVWDFVCSPFGTYAENEASKVRYSIFQKLANRLFAEDRPYDQKKEYFLTALKSNQPHFIRHLIDAGKIKPNQFDRSLYVNDVSIESNIKDLLNKFNRPQVQ